MREAHFPPIFSGRAVSGDADPFDCARGLALDGGEPGLVVYNVGMRRLRAAIVFAPEVPLAESLAVLPICGIGFQNAFGALAPPEMAIHLEWSGEIRLNGAVCGRLRACASSQDPAAEPDWMVCGIELELAGEPGEHHERERTNLLEEGCAEIDPVQLIESWVRHTLYWTNRWLEDGAQPLHEQLRGLTYKLGELVDVEGKRGIFVGMDERFGMLLRDGNQTLLIPLTSRLEF